MVDFLSPQTVGAVLNRGTEPVLVIGGNGYPEPETLAALAIAGHVETGTAVLTGSTVNVVVEFPDDEDEYWAWSEFAPSVDATVSIYLNPTYTGGTDATVINRRIGVAPKMVMKTGVTISDNGTLLITKRAPAAFGVEVRDPSPRIYARNNFV